jgi:uncharacterized protein (TIGR03663 family)
MAAGVALTAITVSALWLRTHELARRPMHADEANQAVRVGRLLETGTYQFDPHDHHGPTLYYVAAALAKLRGEPTLAALTETTVRLAPALIGTLAVVLIAALAAPLGRWPAVAAAALYAVAPAAVYYSRYFIQETLLGTFLLAAFVCVRAWWRTGRSGWAAMAGVCAGFALATKATAPIYGLAAGLALVFANVGIPASKRVGRDLALASVVMLAVAAAWYASFGSNLAGVWDAIASYGFMWDRARGSGGNEQPWWFYLQRFSFYRSGGVVSQQLAFILLAAGGLWAAHKARHSLTRWAAVYTVLSAVALSLISYKTPWNGVHLIPGLTLLAASALAAIPVPGTAAAVAAGVVALQARETWQAAFVRPADERNPYAYVHSSPDVLKLRPLADVALGRDPDGIIRVVSEEYWPLPWYFRDLPRVGYWTKPPDECDGALVIASASLANDVRARLRGAYEEQYLGLRPGVVLIAFMRKP